MARRRDVPDTVRVRITAWWRHAMVALGIIIGIGRHSAQRRVVRGCAM
jgi:hypothetical protein